MSAKRLAEITSIALGMHTWFPIVLVIALLRTGLTTNQIKTLFPLLFLLEVAIPILYIYVLLRLGKVSSWDLTKREERYPFLLLIILCSTTSLVLIYFFGNKLLFTLSVILFLLTIILSITTRFWKISLHTSLNTAGAIMINLLFGWQLPFIYLTIPTIVWARYRLTRHALQELLGGVIISGAFLLGVFKLLKFI